jgi:hypothetical protein
MADICTKADIKTLAFRRAISDLQIGDGIINAIQIRYIKPVLGTEFYNELIANQANYATLIALLKPAIAQYVKFHILPDLAIDISNTGINKIPGNNRSAAGGDELGSVKQSALDEAGLYMAVVTDHLNDNETDYPLYFRSANPENRIEIIGGIISRTDEADIDDYYSNKND